MLKEKQIIKNSSIFLKLRTYQIISIGTYVIYKNMKYLVLESKIKILDNILINDIVLQLKKDFKMQYKNCEKIRGTSILAKVINVVSKNNIAMMKVDFNYGLEKLNKGNQKENKQFVDIAYKTFYSKTNTGFFPSPEKDDIVLVSFLDDDENNLYVSWALENDKSDRFNNIEEQNFNNKYFEFKLSKDNLNIDIKNKLSLNSQKVNLSCDNIYLNSKKEISMATDGYIAIESQKETSIYSNEMNLNSKKGNLFLSSNKKIQLKALKIQSN